MPWPARAGRSALVTDHSAAFAAAYPALTGMDTQESTERTFTTAPPPLRPSTGAKARLIASVPTTWVSNSRRNEPGSPSRMRARVVAPALFTSGVTSVAARDAAATESWSAMSTATGTAPGTATLPGQGTGAAARRLSDAQAGPDGTSVPPRRDPGRHRRPCSGEICRRPPGRCVMVCHRAWRWHGGRDGRGGTFRGDGTAGAAPGPPRPGPRPRWSPTPRRPRSGSWARREPPCAPPAPTAAVATYASAGLRRLPELRDPRRDAVPHPAAAPRPAG
ncbi:hypothetical protein GA0115245_106211 [Streptomyces sp. di188]|nr:hypothetical protein GA0115245_106211 [Streptomyces sp. di188]SCD50901.1 hypothetical protein GA0115238_112611 [Streptomyces sp. di50b]